jgi:hypothetical protein
MKINICMKIFLFYLAVLDYFRTFATVKEINQNSKEQNTKDYGKNH